MGVSVPIEHHKHLNNFAYDFAKVAFNSQAGVAANIMKIAVSVVITVIIGVIIAEFDGGEVRDEEKN